MIGGGESQKVALAGWAGPPEWRIRSMEGVGVLPPPPYQNYSILLLGYIDKVLTYAKTF